MTDYVPIDCGLHSEYELAIMRRQKLRIRWHDTHGMTHFETLLPRDLQTRSGEEFLIAETPEKATLEIRLDHIVETRPVSPR